MVEVSIYGWCQSGGKAEPIKAAVQIGSRDSSCNAVRPNVCAALMQAAEGKLELFDRVPGAGGQELQARPRHDFEHGPVRAAACLGISYGGGCTHGGLV